MNWDELNNTHVGINHKKNHASLLLTKCSHDLKAPVLSNLFIFFSPQEVFPVQYGTKFDTALQALTAGLVCKLEQLLPVPNLSQVCTYYHYVLT